MDDCTIEKASDKPAVASQPNVSIAFTRDSEETVLIGFSYNVSANTTDFKVTPHKNYESVVSTQNLNQTDGSSYKWTGDGTPSLTVAVNATDPNAETQMYFDDWMYEATPRVTHSWATASQNENCGRAFGMSTDRTVTRADDGAVAVGTSKFLLGTSVETRTRTVSSGETIRVMVPKAAAEDFREANGPNPYDTVFSQLDKTSKNYHSEASTENTIHVYVVPWTRGGSGVTHSTPASSSMFWIWGTQPATGTINPWVHEYVHTQQQFHLGENMYWFKEASARYLEVKHGLNASTAEDIDSTHAHWSRTRFPDSTLAERNSWSESGVPYYKGGRVLFKLDQRLNAHSDLSMIDVVQWMNEHDGRVTYSDFRQFIVSHTTEETGDWLDQHVQTNESIHLSEDDFHRLNETE